MMLVRPALWFCACNLLVAALAAQCSNPVTTVSDGTYTSGDHSASDNNALKANNFVISGGATATFVAGNCIDLRPGFRATAGTAGTTFHAWVETAPAAVSFLPSGNSGMSQTFTWVVSSPSGYSNLSEVQALFNTTSQSTQNACYIRYNRGANLLYLADNSGANWSAGFTPGSAGSANNSYCSIYGSGSSFNVSGTQLTVAVLVTFQPAFLGTKTEYLKGFDNEGLNTTWMPMGSWTIVPSPSITGLSPSAGTTGAAVTISGANFGATQGTSTVTFNGVAATATNWSTASIATNVPTGATSGNVIVTVGGLSSNAVPFTVTSAPTISSLSATSGPIGACITISGANFGSSQGTNTVKFNGTVATVNSWSATSISAAVPTGTTSGNVIVTVGGLASNGIFFTVSSAPGITSLSPNVGSVGTPVIIAGTNFGATQGTSTLTFNGTSATVSSWSATSITAAVPGGATTGNVIVTVGGVASGGVFFTVTSGPTITNISPTSGPIGGAVTITGTNFGSSQGSSSVTFNGTLTSVVTSWSATSISVVVPAGATSGNLVVTVLGVASNAFAFSVLPPPVITALAPIAGAAGTAVTVTGSNFGGSQGTSSVRFNGTPATAITIWSATSIITAVPPGATSGPVSVVVNGATASSPQSFTVNSTVEPSITSITPANGAAGASVTIAGANFGSPQGSSTVTFNGVQATALSWSNSSIIAVVPAAASSGDVVVQVNSVSSNPAPFTVGVVAAREYIRLAGRAIVIENSAPQVLPTISGLSVTTGTVGTSVTITGTNFGTSQPTVRFNGTSATPASWSATSIQTAVPSGATSGNVVVTVSGVSSNGLYFTVTTAPSIPSLGIIKSHSGSFVRGQQGIYTINISNASNAGPTSGTVAVSDAIPSGLSFANMYGTGWGCSGSICGRSDVLAPGGSYPPVSVVVNVASNAPSSVVNQATVSGGNNPSPVTVSDTTNIVTAPTLAITKTHGGNFIQGQTGTFTITVTNQPGTLATSGLVTVTEYLPTGLTMSYMQGTGWSCSGNACSRSDSLASGASYPTITVVVNAVNTGTFANAVSVSGGGSASASAPPDYVNVVLPSTAPQWVSVVPNTGTGTIGAAQTFQVTFSDANGAADITNMQFMLNASPSNAGGCWVWYSSGTFYLADSTGQSWSSTNLSNGLCTLNLGSSSVTDVDSITRRIFVNLSFNENVFSGLKYMYTWAQDSTGLNTGNLFSTWRGSWTIPANISVSINPSVSQNVALGHTQAFTASVIGSPNTNVNWSLPDGGGTLVPNGNSATYAAPATTPGAWLRVRATSQADSTKYGETWVNILPYGPNGLTLLTFSPTNGAGNRATFTFGVEDVYGVAHVTWLQPFFSVTFPLNTGAGGCHMIFYPTNGNPSTGIVYLDGPGGGNTWSGGSSAVGAGGTTLQNGLCTVYAGSANSSIQLVNNDYYVQLDIEFQSSLLGAAKREYLSAGSLSNPWPGTDWLYWGWWY